MAHAAPARAGILQLSSTPKTDGSIRRILVLRTGHIGDVVLMTPALDLLHALFPAAEISALVRAGAEPVLQGNPLIRNVYIGGRIVGQQRMLTQTKSTVWNRWRQIPSGLSRVAEMRKERFDLAVDFTGGDRTALYARLSGATIRVARPSNGSGFIGRNRLFTHLAPSPRPHEHKVRRDLDLLRTAAEATGRAESFQGLSPGPTRIYCSPEDVDWAREQWRLHADNTGPRILIHPASRVLYKCWDPAGWGAVMDRLAAETGAAFMVTSGPDAREIQIARATAAASGRALTALHAGGLTLRRLAALIQEADLFLGVDTAPMHIAAAVGTRVVAVFGPSDEQLWGPWGAGHVVVRRECRCLAQRQRGCDEAAGMECLKALTSDEVHQAALKILTESTGARAQR